MRNTDLPDENIWKSPEERQDEAEIEYNKKNSSDMKEHFGLEVGKKCSICGRELKGNFYSNKPLCYSCWKNQLADRNSIKSIMSRLGENSVSGKKKWQDLQRQQEAENKNYVGRKNE